MRTITTILSAIALGAATALMACSEDSPKTTKLPEKPFVNERGSFAKGADISWVTELESAGYTFYTPDGNPKELFSLLRDECGVNSIRLRVWVNPAEGWNNIDDVMVKAIRAYRLGMRLMVDFHFSDTWADPGAQTIPDAWKEMTVEEVAVAMAEHVNALMTRLKTQGIEPEWVQIGNETRTGMMWPLGDIASGDNFTKMVNAGHDAVKAVFPDASVIVHVDCGDQPALYTTQFGKLKNEGGRYDMIGMSLYPDPSNWQQTVDACVENIKKVQTDFGKPVMLCEIGLDYTEADAADQMMRSIMAKGKEAGLKGIFWWEPEAPADRGYTKGCFDGGMPTKALDCFKEK